MQRRLALQRVLFGIVAIIALALPSLAQPANAFPLQSGNAKSSQDKGDAESALRKGISLTRQGLFQEAITPLVQAQGRVVEEYAARFNLALCYFGTGNYVKSIEILKDLRSSSYGTAAVNNLLAQAYVGERQPEQAIAALTEASRQTPNDEKLYAYVSDASTDHYEYDLGLRVADLGLKHLPESARLHYERAMFLARLDRFEEAKPEFDRASELAPESDIAYLAVVQKELYEDNFAEALRSVRRGLQSGHRDYQMLSLLGTILMHVGVAPGQPEFIEAREALEASVAVRPNYSTSQIALGKLCLMENRVNEAVVHLEIGRSLEPRNLAIYPSLAEAYRRRGDLNRSHECLKILSGLLREKSLPMVSPNR
jgi:Putative Zn-dependent protease, contains TPR repeats